MDYQVKFTPNLNLALLPANYRIWAQIMNDNLTTLDAAINGFVQFSNLRGAWSNSTHYAVGDTVVDETTAVLWTALIDHISAQIPTTFAEDSLAHPGTWILAAAPATQRGVWTTATAYNVGDFVLADGLKFAMCIVQHVSGPTFDGDNALGYWTVLVDLSIAGSQVLPILSGAADALKFVNTDAGGTAYEIVNGTTAMERLEGILPVAKGGTGVITSTGIPGSVVLSQSPTITTPTISGTLTGTTATFSISTTTPYITAPVASLLILNADAGQRIDHRINNAAVTRLTSVASHPAVNNAMELGVSTLRWSNVYSVLGNFSGALTGTTATLSTAIPAASNDTTVPTTAWVKANAGSSTTVGIIPPVSPADGQMWFNNDSAVGGGQLFIRYNDGSTTQWVPASPSVTTETTPGGDFMAYGTSATLSAGVDGLVTFTTVGSGNSGGWYSTSTGRFTPPAGKYHLSSSITFNSAPAANSTVLYCLRKNGVRVPASYASESAPAASYAITLSYEQTVDANGTDYFDWVANVTANTAGPFGGWFSAFPLSGVKGPPGDYPSGALFMYSEQVCVGGETQMNVTIPANCKRIELEYSTQAASGDPTLQLQTVQSGVVFTSSNHSLQEVYGNASTAAGYSINSQPFWNLNGVRHNTATIKFFANPTGWIGTVVRAQISTTTRYAYITEIDGGAPIASTTGFRLTLGTSSFTAGSYFRAYVVV